MHIRPACLKSLTLVLFIVIFLVLPSCQVPDYLYYNLADINDYRIFPSITIHRAADPDELPVAVHSASPLIPDLFQVQNAVSFESLLEKNKTVAFLILRNDTIVYEKYFDGYDRSSVLPSFSVSKSVVSALVGIAIKEGYIKSLEQPITDFIPGMKDPGFHKVTLRNLLEMRSGIRYNEGYFDPFGHVARFYYGEDIRRAALNLKIEQEPDRVYVYQSANAQLLAMAIENATGKKLAVYAEEKLWKPLRMEYDATWSVDSREHAEVKAFCCLNARAVDFARFGLLYENGGVFEGDTIVPPSWVKESLTIHNNSLDSQRFPYAYQWRVTRNGNYFAKGILGQYIFICPSRNLVIVRFGKNLGNIPWVDFFEELSRQF